MVVDYPNNCQESALGYDEDLMKRRKKDNVLTVIRSNLQLFLNKKLGIVGY